MKRIHKLFIVAILTLAIPFIIYRWNQIDYNELQPVCSYELVAAKVDSATTINGQLSGMYLLGFGGMSGNIETTATKAYNYFYKREDGGIISATINMDSYNYPETVTIVIYENDSTTPKVEIWRNCRAIDYGDGTYLFCKTEIRFTIPSGSFVNTYDFQGIAENSQ